MTHSEELVFGLDIGTRSIVGTVGYREGTDRFVVVAQEAIEHTTRAVIDGQIHDIPTVSMTIKEIKEKLEARINKPLVDVSIAAAGRVLKTKQVHAVYEFASDTRVTKDHIRSLDMLGVESAYAEIRNEVSKNKIKFFCVGYSAVKYYLNDYPMEMIEMHTASSIGVDLIATFLPEEVVDGLYAVVEGAGLRVANLTLEPIAAIQVAIPEKFRLLNIALVDVGAGTSDISIVKDGSIVAFGMIPLAGDEITEAIAQRLLIDFSTAEKIKRQYERRKLIQYKNIFGEKIKVEKELIAEIVEETTKGITKKVADNIIKLNGNKPISAVFVVGGGGKHEGFTESLANALHIPQNRVAIRGAEVLKNIIFEQEGIKKDSTLVTPIGICMNFYEANNNFIHLMVNGQGVKIYDNGKVTVLDACINCGFSKENLFPAKGKTVHYTINGEARSVKGKMGEVAIIRRNGRQVSLNELVKENDTIKIKPSTKGEDGSLMIADIPECREEIRVKVYGKEVLCPYTIEVNGEMKSLMYEVQDGDEIRTFDYFSVGTLFDYVDMIKPELILLNGSEAGMTAKVKEGDVIEKRPAPKEDKPIEEAAPVLEETVQEQMQNDPLLQKPQPLPEWASDIPGLSDVTENETQENTSGEMPETPPAESEAPSENPKEREETKEPFHRSISASSKKGPIQVKINGEMITLPEKKKPIFVDIFDVYPFDLTKAGGTRLITRINGVTKDFTQPLFEGDEIDLYWEK